MNRASSIIVCIAFVLLQQGIRGAAPMESKPLSVTIPETVEAFPREPADPNTPGFKLRGTKGWQWSARQYLEEIPHLKRVKMNFLMNCYLSMLDDESHKNLWWQPLPDAKKREYERVVKACGEAGIIFCFAMHPQLRADRPLKFDSDADFELFFSHFAWMQSLGVKWFSIAMDDVGGGDQGKAHALFCNRFLARLRQTDPGAQLIFCPAPYATSMIKGNESYLPELAKELHRDVYLFWTGPEVVSATITREDADQYRKLCGHRLILWDNYPVNDGYPTMHLGPITGRDPALTEVVDGYISNPLYAQSRVNRIPLYTMADFAYNPRGYDPNRSIGEAIALLADTGQARRTLGDLVETYPGMLLAGNGMPAFNPPIAKAEEFFKSPSGRSLAQAHLVHLQSLLERVIRDLHETYPDAEAQLRRDVNAVEAMINSSNK
jgi:hyaluronoglucosaminidase